MAKSITNLQMRSKERIYKKTISPIVNAILKQIGYRHSTMREFVNENSL